MLCCNIQFDINKVRKYGYVFRVVLITDAFDCGLDALSLYLTEREGDLEFANDPHGIILNSLRGATIVAVGLFIMELFAFIRYGKINPLWLALTIGFEDCFQCTIYTFVAVSNDVSGDTKLGFWVGIANSAVFGLGKLLELYWIYHDAARNAVEPSFTPVMHPIVTGECPVIQS